MDNNFEVDFVVTWVDGGDIKWQKEKKKYDIDFRGSVEDSIQRFRDWENMRYWFRSVEKYAPWVRKVFFVTYGHVPNFLNIDSPKVQVIRHEEIIDKQYLPTFNSCAIEVNLNKIPGLAEHFVYFNDDMFITRPISKSTFFNNYGLPKLEAIESPISSYGDNSAYSHHLLNNVDVINRNFNKRKFIKENFTKFFNIKYQSKILNNFLMLPWKNFNGFYNTHLPSANLKSTWNDVWRKEGKVLEQTTSHKFRTFYDVNPSLFTSWQIATGEFSPDKVNGKVFSISDSAIADIRKAIIDKKNDFICLNDDISLSEQNFKFLKNSIKQSFNQCLPEKSSFEIKGK